MATSPHSLSSGEVGFKPLNNLQKNVDETLLAVCVPPTGSTVLTGGEIHLSNCYLSRRCGILGTAGLIKVWDVLSGRLQTQILVGPVILKLMWIPLSKVQAALVVGSEDGSVLLYWYWSPSKFGKFVLSLLPVSSVSLPI